MTEMNSIRLKSVRELRTAVTSPLFVEAIQAIQKEAFTRLLATPGQATELREQIYTEIKALDRVVSRLKSIANEITMLPGDDLTHGG